MRIRFLVKTEGGVVEVDGRRFLAYIIKGRWDRVAIIVER